MLNFVIGLFTVVLVLDCALLILLVLVQLPKKEAGAGMAFGGAATDALFGAGSGNVLTKVTKYATIIFFVLTLLMAVLNTQNRKAGGSLLKDKWSEGSKSAAPAVAPLATSHSNSVAPSVTPTLETTNVVSPTVSTNAK
ncbi:MAG: preprotein translocase subunit SecG [Verrucomicrobiales bacterium]|nr:preprotein translocase subunit SecG [Verrucomicrobiales bacterium]